MMCSSGVWPVQLQPAGLLPPLIGFWSSCEGAQLV